MLKSVRVVDIDLGTGSINAPSPTALTRAASVLRALAIADLEPPLPQFRVAPIV